MKIAAALFSICFFIAFQYYTFSFMWRYAMDFPFSAGIMQLTLALSVLFSIFIINSVVRKKKLGVETIGRMGWAGTVLSILSCLYWGAFGLAAFIVALLFFIFPKLTRARIKNPENRIAWMLLLQALCLTAPQWFQLF